MTAKPIIFQPGMIHALLREIERPGSGKSQTRRVLSPGNTRLWTGGLDYGGRDMQPSADVLAMAMNNARDFRQIEGRLSWVSDPCPHQHGAAMSQWLGRCAYGSRGSLLWVREVWCHFPASAPDGMGENVYYRADPHNEGATAANTMAANGVRWRSPIHLPRKWSRITLLLTDVRVGRIQSISNEDAVAEGIGTPMDMRYAATDGFRPLWDSINAEPKPVHQDGQIVAYISFPWEDIQETRQHCGKPWYVHGNPWVWALTFKPLLANIDTVLADPGRYGIGGAA